MIKSFKHKGLKKFFQTGNKPGIQAQHAAKLQLILTYLDAAADIESMNQPAFRLHKLSGSRSKIWSVWVNGNWRVTFKFENGDVEIVNYEDYH